MSYQDNWIYLFLLFPLFASAQLQGLLEGKLNASHVKRVSEQMREVLEHFKQEDPVGLPGAPIPDPMPIPDFNKAFTFGRMYMVNSTVHGLSQFRLHTVRSNLANMQVEMGLSYDKVEVLGNYSLRGFFSTSRGGYNVTLTGVYIEGMANLSVAQDGYLEATDISMDCSFSDVMVDFRNLGLLAKFFQTVINAVGSFFFDTIKPFILQEVNTNIRGDINKDLRAFKQTFPNSIPPLDLAIARGRKLVREMGYDPLQLADYTHYAGIITLEVKDIWLRGLASFYRVGNLTLEINNHTLELGLDVATKQLKGLCKWEVSAGWIFSTGGTTSFTVDQLHVQTKLNQSLDVRNRPRLETLELGLGNIQLSMDGLGTFDYVMEFLVNILPNILRYQIIDGVEGILKLRIQEHLDLIDTELFVESKLKELDELTNPKTNELVEYSQPEYLNQDDLYL